MRKQRSNYIEKLHTFFLFVAENIVLNEPKTTANLSKHSASYQL